MTRISSLPTHWTRLSGEVIDLSQVPSPPQRIPGADLPTHAEMRKCQLEYLGWGTELVRYRASRVRATEGLIPGMSPEREKALELARCVNDPKYFIAVWTNIFEYREEQLVNFPWYNKKAGGWLPFVPFPFQLELIDWLHERTNSTGLRGNGAISKSRDMGVTDTCCRFALWAYLFKDPSHTKFVSRMSDLVDQLGNMDSIMERVTSQLEENDFNMPVPDWMRPAGWTRSDHRKLRLLTSPASRNQISGEATSERTGRGGRCWLALIDEAAFIEKFRQLITALQSTATHVIALSSESARFGEGFIAYQDMLRKEAPECLLELDYWLHPFHDELWVDEQRKRYGENINGFKAEILRDPYADIGDPMYPDAAHIEFLDEEVDIRDLAGARLVIGIDPGLADETALHWIAYRPGLPDILLQSYEITERRPADFIAAIIAGVDPLKHPEFNFSRADERILEWVRAQPQPGFIFGDPYGYRENALIGDSFYEVMMRWWRQNNPRFHPKSGLPNVYPIKINWKKEQNEYQGRRHSLMRRLRTMQFNPNDEVRRSVLALQRSRWEDDSVPRVREAQTAKHDVWSHRRTALEFAAVNLDVLDGFGAGKSVSKQSDGTYE
jgi:hypothetical protein